jgi:hypothetical protein
MMLMATRRFKKPGREGARRIVLEMGNSCQGLNILKIAVTGRKRRKNSINKAVVIWRNKALSRSALSNQSRRRRAEF